LVPTPQPSETRPSGPQQGLEKRAGTPSNKHAPSKTTPMEEPTLAVAAGTRPMAAAAVRAW
jgi:hypothetical protein